VLAAQLKLMQAQVEPHFLFNTLAAVQHQVEVNPPAAGRLLSSLVRYLRAALPQMRSDLSTVGREFDLARAYLEIAAGRLCGRLAFEVNLPEELAGLAMPPMMLISLVENAITHGVEQCSEDCRVRVCARREQDRLLISVEDDGAGLGDPGAGCGIGLSNLRARLQVLYGDHAGLALHARTPRGVTARIDLPLPP
jgi:LytS/YehU family sensor histidine kinase